MPSAVSFLRVISCAFAMYALAVQTVPAAQSMIYIVTRNDDPAPDGCAPGDCSLREAMLAANANFGPRNEILLDAATYGLPRGGLTFQGQLKIAGKNSATTTIEGDGIDPVLTAGTDASIQLLQLAIKAHGKHALDASVNGDTFLYRLRIPEADSQIWVPGAANGTGNFQLFQGEIHAYVNCGHAALCQLSDSQVLRLQVGSGSNALTRVYIAGSTIDGDLASSQDSGVVVQTQGRVTITHSTIQRTTFGLSIVAAAPSVVEIDHLHFVENEAPLRLSVPSDMTIDTSEFRANVNGGQLGSGGGALWLDDSGATATVTNSTFAGNSGSDVAGGAALVEAGAALSVRNSTFSNNSFLVTAVASPHGAAIGYINDAAITSIVLDHVTMVAPTIIPAIGIVGTTLGGYGGESGLVLTVRNSIVRGSCGLEAAAMDFNIGNIESGGNTCQFGAGDNQINVSSTSLALGSLGDHGGPTLTYKPAPGSVAIDAADATYCTEQDQRGYPRPFGDACDVGSVEADDDVLFANGFE